MIDLSLTELEHLLNWFDAYLYANEFNDISEHNTILGKIFDEIEIHEKEIS